MSVAEWVAAFVICAVVLAAIFAVDTWAARRHEARRPLPPLNRHRWQGDDEHQP